MQFPTLDEVGGYPFRSRRTVVRIDHILVGRGGWATECWLGPLVESPHRPGLAVVKIGRWPVVGNHADWDDVESD